MEKTISIDPVTGLACPVPLQMYDSILLAHGSGGKLTQQLIDQLFLPSFRNEQLEQLHDGAIISVDGTKLAFSTDSYIIDPIFFPGGDIGELAVNGTVNDLAMCGAEPLYLSCAMIIEEGFPMSDLARVVGSMRDAARRAGVKVVTGDTKVVDRGKGDKLFINTAGVGRMIDGLRIDPSQTGPGDRIILSGPIAMHGIAIMSVRKGLEFDTRIESDTAPLNGLVSAMAGASRNIRVLRDPTRGGVASALNEIARSANAGIHISEELIRVPDEVRGACEIFGFDPLYVANEGKLLAFVPANDAEKVLNAMHGHTLGRDAALIGEVVSDHPGTVVLQTAIGGHRIVDMLSGEQLPRIC